MSNATVTPENWTEYKGQAVTAQHVDGETIIEGTLISLNSKGWNFNVDGKTVTRAENSIVDVSTGDVQGIEDPESFDADAEPDVADNDEGFEEGMSTRELEEMRDEDTDSDDEDDDLEAVSDDDAESTESETAEGHSTAELAALFNTSARALRIRLRKMGLGVGKGKTYAFTDDQMDELKTAFTKEPVEA